MNTIYRNSIYAPQTKTNRVFAVSWLVLLFIFQSNFHLGSFNFLMYSFVLATLGLIFTLYHEPNNTLNPAKLFTLLYVSSFAIAPVWLLDKRVFEYRYLGYDLAPLMDRTAFLSLVGYLFFLLSYFLGYKRSASPQKSSQIVLRELKSANQFSVLLGLVSFVFYFLLIVKSGGLNFLLGFSGGRADLFGDTFGGFFWGAHLFFSAYGFFLVAHIKSKPKTCFLLGTLLSLLFVPFHGRDLIVAPFICWLLAYHSLNRRVTWKMVGVSAVVLISLSGVIAAFRSGGNALALKDPVAFINAFFENFNQYFGGVIATNIEQFDSAMIAVKFVEKEKVVLGPLVLTGGLEPLDRLLFGNSIQSIYSGVFLDLLVMPEHKGWNTALSPSIVGELWLSLGWGGITLGMLVLGYVFSILTRWSNNCKTNLIMFAAYPFVTYMLCKLVVDGTTHLFRPLLVFASITAIWLVYKKPTYSTPLQNIKS